jgi:hypothetical protein
MLVSKYNIKDHAILAKSLIDNHTHTTTWRTATRIHELIRINTPSWYNNFFIRDEKEFAILLSAMSYEQELKSIDFPRLPLERYEGGHHEPIMLCDTQFPGKPLEIHESMRWKVPRYITNDVRAYIIQREMYRLIREGRLFEESYNHIRDLNPTIREQYVHEFEQWGMEHGNIFYRKIDDSSNRARKTIRTREIA